MDPVRAQGGHDVAWGRDDDRKKVTEGLNLNPSVTFFHRHPGPRAGIHTQPAEAKHPNQLHHPNNAIPTSYKSPGHPE